MKKKEMNAIVGECKYIIFIYIYIYIIISLQTLPSVIFWTITEAC